MKVKIELKRETTYTAIVEMDEATFNRLDKDLDGGKVEQKRAEKEINRLIKPDDWTDDELIRVEDFGKAED